MDLPEGLAPASLVVAGGRPPRTPGAPVNTPVELASTYAVEPDHVGYGRNQNATWAAFEDVLGALEGGSALVYASGMAAISAALSLLPGEGAVVAPSTPYNVTAALLRDLADAGREVRWVEPDDTSGVIGALDGASRDLAGVPDEPAHAGRGPARAHRGGPGPRCPGPVRQHPRDTRCCSDRCGSAQTSSSTR